MVDIVIVDMTDMTSLTLHLILAWFSVAYRFGISGELRPGFK